MEHMSESLERTALTISTPDPYATAHALLHSTSRFGRVVERENRMFTTGPRTTADIKFYVEKELDKFTHLHVAFDLSGDITAASLSAVIEATLECSLSTPRGLGGATFNEFYLSHLWPSHLRLAQKMAAEVIGYARQRLSADKEVK